MERSKVFELLAAKGAAKALVHYSGGHDEGGVNAIQLLDKDETEIGQIEEFYGPEQVWNAELKKYIDGPAPTEEQELSKALCAPVYDKYYSFAGEYSVSGEVTWDVTTRKVAMTGEESFESWDSFEEELD